jgi:hypothetical protein
MHPGNVATSMGSNNRGALWRLAYVFINLLGMTPERGADTVIFLAAAPEVEGVSGEYFVKRRAVRSSRASRDETAAKRLWQVSEQMVVQGNKGTDGNKGISISSSTSPIS